MESEKSYFGKNVKKIIVYQTIVLIILLLFGWFWFGDFCETLAFTIASTVIVTLFHFSFEYVYQEEWLD